MQQFSERPSARPLALAMAGALALALLLAWPTLLETWRTGVFRDADDATRMVEVRDFLGGQGWYDLQLKRLGLPGAPDMHWSRIIDLPIAALVRLFDIFLDPVLAERAARILFPLLLFAALLGFGALLAMEVAGGAALAPILLLLALSGLPLGQFHPGRIDHHAPQILLLVAAAWLMLRALRRAESGFLCALALAVSLGISLENMPIAAAIGLCFVGFWVVDAGRHGAALRFFAQGLLLGLPLVLAINLPASRWGEATCDAFSIAHFALGWIGAGLCLALAVAGARLADRGRRFAVAALAGGALGGVALAFFSTCLVDPYAGLDPLVRATWLDHVGEALSIARALRDTPGATLVYLIPGSIGLAGLVFCASTAAPSGRLRWAALLLVTLASACVASWRVGALANFVALASVGTAGLLVRLPRLRIVGAALLSGAAFALILPGDAGPKGAGCHDPASFATLASLPPGIVLTPINDGAHALASTPHRVLAAPYHRNNAGNVIAARAFTQPADEALATVRASGADYLAFCPIDAPLARRLATQGAPGFARVDAPGPLLLFRIAR